MATEKEVVKLNNFQSALRTKGRSKPVPFAIESLGGEVFYFLALTAGQAGEYQFNQIGNDGKVNIQKLKFAKIRLLVMSVVDEQGNKVLTDADLIDADNKVIDEMAKIATDLNGFTIKKDDAEEAGNG